ncbi:MAG TPA: efflux RND transporter periplasmic adaptor subunit [Stellaceae bacterium]|nr:efflux RND transporter periplasmic adaptor subunit [Stellaceae bacterium]
MNSQALIVAGSVLAVFVLALLAFVFLRRRWLRLALMAVMLAIVLTGLWGFNRFRAEAINQAFSHFALPPTPVAAEVARVESVARSISGIGTLQAVRQVTVVAEVGGRIKDILFQPGTTVEAGTPLVQLNDEPEQGDLANFKAQARLAEVSLNRSRDLVTRQAVPQQTVDQNQATLDEARAGIAKTEAQIRQKVIRAPFAGELGIRQVNLGQYLNPGGAIVSLTDLSVLYVNFTMPEQDRSLLVQNGPIELMVDAYPGEVFKGTIDAIDPQIDPATRAIRVQGTLANPDRKLLPGMFANVSVALPPEPAVVTVPATAVDYTLYGDSVFIVKREGTDQNGKPIDKAERSFVKVGERYQGRVAILEGVKGGDLVVISGQLKLQSGIQVIVQPSNALDPPAKIPNS